MAQSKSLQLDFSISDIKASIEKLVSSSNGKYRILDKNETFNTFRIGSSFNRLQSGIISITLKKNDEAKTDWKSDIVWNKGMEVTPGDLTRHHDEFLSYISKALNGEPLTAQVFNANKKGCAGVLLLIIGLTGILSFCLFR